MRTIKNNVMYYKIQKSLGAVSAVLTETIPTAGVCVEFQRFDQRDASIILYQDGQAQDLHVNGWTFPCVYNDIELRRQSDIYGGKASHEIRFEAIGPAGSIQVIQSKSLYGQKESLAVEYFCSLLYNISCCRDAGQFKDLYRYIIDNNWFQYHRERKEAVEVLQFIESFMPRLGQLEDDAYIPGLKQKLSVKYRVA